MNNIDVNPVGIFDSGIGGITVLREIERLLPHENIVYLADDKNCPYGTKSNQEIIDLSVKSTETLLSMGAKVIIVACNTATMASISALRAKFDVKFVAIEPAVKSASSATKSGIFGVLATKSATLSQQLNNLCEQYASDKVIVIQAGVGLVTLVEQDKQDSDEAYNLLKSYIEPMIEKGIDHLVLGCTHYPFFKYNLERIIANKNIKLIDPAEAITKQLKKILEQQNLLNPSKELGEIKFYSTNDAALTHNKRIEQRYHQYKEIKK